MSQRQKSDIQLYQGDTKSYQFNFFTNSAKTIPWDISGATNVVLSVKKSLDASAVLFSVSATSGSPGNSWASGILVFEIPSSESVKLSANGKYDVQLTLASKTITPVYGDVIVQKQVAP